jgi:hypothetical protein
MAGVLSGLVGPDAGKRDVTSRDCVATPLQETGTEREAEALDALEARLQVLAYLPETTIPMSTKWLGHGTR